MSVTVFDDNGMKCYASGLEPEAVSLLHSQTISLKRIADALEKMDAGRLDGVAYTAGISFQQGMNQARR